MTDLEYEEMQRVAKVLVRFGELSARLRGLEKFIERLADNAASQPKEIVSTGRLTPSEIIAARADGRMFTLDSGLGFVIRPMSQHPENFKWWDWKCQQQGCQSLCERSGDKHE